MFSASVAAQTSAGGTGRSASQAVKRGECLELAELLIQIGRGRADDEAVDALGGVGIHVVVLHVDRTRVDKRALTIYR